MFQVWIVSTFHDLPSLQRQTKINSPKFLIINQLQWRHIQQWIKLTTKRTSMPEITGPFAGNPPVIGGFLAKRANSVESIFMSWCHHDVWVYLRTSCLTHWGRLTYLCVGNLTIIGSDNSLAPVRCQDIIWIKASILSVRPWLICFSEILFKIQKFSFNQDVLENVICQSGGHLIPASVC